MVYIHSSIHHHKLVYVTSNQHLLKTVQCHLSHTKEGWGRFLISHQNKNEWSIWIRLLCLSQSRPYIKRSKVWFCRLKISRSLNLLFSPNSQSTSMELEYKFQEYCDKDICRKDTFILSEFYLRNGKIKAWSWHFAFRLHPTPSVVLTPLAVIVSLLPMAFVTNRLARRHAGIHFIMAH